MKTACISRYGAFGDLLHVAHIPELIKKHYGIDHVTVETNYQGVQIFAHNPFVDEVKQINPLQFTWSKLEKHWDYLQDSYDYFFNFFHHVEYGNIAMEDEPNYFRNSKYRREKFGKTPFCDSATKLAGLPDSYLGTRGKMYFPEEQHEKTRQWLESCRKKYGVDYIALVCLSGSSLHKKFIQASEVCLKLLDKHPDTMVITTGDEYCKKQDFSHPRVLSKVASWNFRTVALASKYVDFYIGPNTGLSCVANSWDTPTIQLFTADSMVTHSSYAKNAFGVQSSIYCSPCHKGPYKYVGCPIKEDHPACVFHDVEKIMSTVEEVRNVCLTRTAKV